jgi:hypothetical protein
MEINKKASEKDAFLFYVNAVYDLGKTTLYVFPSAVASTTLVKLS